jgi:hypothetical protein
VADAMLMSCPATTRPTEPLPVKLEFVSATERPPVIPNSDAPLPTVKLLPSWSEPAMLNVPFVLKYPLTSISNSPKKSTAPFRSMEKTPFTSAISTFPFAVTTPNRFIPPGTLPLSGSPATMENR